VEKMKSFNVGGGLDKGVDIGPAINRRSFDNGVDAIKKSIEMGARLLLDGT